MIRIPAVAIGLLSCMAAGLSFAADADMALLKELIEIPSITTNAAACNRAVAFMKGHLEAHGIFCTVKTMADGREVLFACTERTKTPDVLFGEHLDVVSASPEMFVPREEDGVIYGRGASDCKCHCVLAAKVLRELKGRVSVGCIFATNEEAGGTSTAFMLDKGYGARKMVVVFDSEQYRITTRQKGLAEYRIRRAHPAVHAGFVKGHVPSAIDELISGYRAVRAAYPDSEDGSWRDVVTCSWLEGNRTKATLALRVLAAGNDTWPRFERLLTELFGSWEIVRKGDAVILDESAPYLHEYLARMRKMWPDKDCGFYHLNSSTDARHLQRLGLPMLILCADGRGAHSPDERFYVKSFEENYKLISEYLLDFTGTSSAK